MVRNISSSFSIRQHGVALLVFMLFIFLAATTWILGQSSGTNARNQRDKLTATVMAQAKEALIGRAATDDNRPGSLPCPDVNNDGIAELFVGSNCPSYIGRFPWKTLDLPELLDGNGDRLWYALSPGLRDYPIPAQPINSQKALELTLDGTPNIAAIIFSPGPPIANQNSRPSNAVADYLDGSNNDGDYAYVSGPSSATFNDKVLAITRDDLFRTVNQRVLSEIRGPDDSAPGAPQWGLRRYYANNASFPWADSGSDYIGDVGMTAGNLPYNDFSINPASLAWLSANVWLPLVTYQRLSASSARITIGTSKMDVIPCPSSPCP
jgi:hypothetical protein